MIEECLSSVAEPFLITMSPDKVYCRREEESTVEIDRGLVFYRNRTIHSDG